MIPDSISEYPAAFPYVQGSNPDRLPMFDWPDCISLMRLVYPACTLPNRDIILWDHAPNMPLTEHTHTFFEAAYVLSGSAGYHLAQNFELLHAGDFCIVPPMTPHYLHANGECSLLTVTIRPEAFRGPLIAALSGSDVLSDFLKKTVYRGDTGVYFLIHTECDEGIRTAFLNMLGEMGNSDIFSDRIVASAMLQSLLYMMRTYGAFLQTLPSKPSCDQSILSLIYEQYSTITLSEVAERLHYTVPYCSKYLKNCLGCTFSALIRQIRFQKAENLLLHSDMTVTQISKEIGYENPENFLRAFKHHYHMTPSQYRISKAAPDAEHPQHG